MSKSNNLSTKLDKSDLTAYKNVFGFLKCYNSFTFVYIRNALPFLKNVLEKIILKSTKDTEREWALSAGLNVTLVKHYESKTIDEQSHHQAVMSS